jgi:hypothetical protein
MRVTQKDLERAMELKQIIRNAEHELAPIMEDLKKGENFTKGPFEVTVTEIKRQEVVGYKKMQDLYPEVAKMVKEYDAFTVSEYRTVRIDKHEKVKVKLA